MEHTLEEQNLEQVKELIDEIADREYEPPFPEQVEKMKKLTGVDWSDEDLRLNCCEYWSHNSLEETAYFMFHEDYPPVYKVELVFWKYKPNVQLDNQTVYDTYRFGRGTLNALEELPLEKILENIRNEWADWKEYKDREEEMPKTSWRFDCLTQETYWTETHFWVFEDGKEMETHREHHMITFSCHNMSEEQIGLILNCMEVFGCPLQIRKDENIT